ncbi:MAG TPA: acetyl-CoA carboxylase biotin carboxyl carrier protein, partial [bacterium]|nr:acetyl-CoA carboxylase biotin carboxyl carrier protein [bacterium]
KGDFSLILGKKGALIQKEKSSRTIEKVAKTLSEEEILEDFKHPTQQLEDVVYVKAPLVGTFYRAPSPESPPFVEVGSKVKKGDTLCIVEAMKVMNEIKSDYDGTVKEILVENGKSVEYGQVLFILQLSSTLDSSQNTDK